MPTLSTMHIPNKKLSFSLLVVLGSFLAVTGCETAQSSSASAPQNTPKAVGTETVQQDTLVIRKAQSAQRGMGYSWQAFPSSATSPEAAQVLIEKEVPTEVKPGQQYSYDIIITNRTNFPTDSLVLTEILPDNFKLIQAQPNAEVRQNALRWQFGMLAPGQREVITITGEASRSGTVSHSNSAELTFALGRLSSVVAVVEPLFEFRIDAPAANVVADVFPAKLEFRNAGTAPIREAKLLHTLPKGLLTAEGHSRIEIEIGNLQPGDRRTYDVNLMGEAVGLYESKFVATARDGLTANANFKTSIQKPELEIVTSVPTRRYVGNIIPYEITIKNVGDAPARDLTVRQFLSAGTTLASANEGGTAQDNVVIWNVGTLQPGETKRVSSRVVAKQIMTVRSTADAVARAADRVDAAMVTDVEGIAAILVELADLNDPVAVGDTETYIISAINQGSLPATRITLTCMLEDSMEFVEASGATKARLEGKEVVFEPLPALEPQAQAQWRVVVRARKEGDVRFGASINSDQLTRPVVRFEATHFYK